jgi:hypothetical protein
VIVLHWLRIYWDWAGSNVGAMPACGIAAFISAVVFRKPLGRLWDRINTDMHRDVRGELAEIREVAEAGRRIAAATHRHVTGTDHPDAPSEQP